MRKIRSRWISAIPMPLSSTVKRQASMSRVGGDADYRPDVGGDELQGVGEKVLKEQGELAWVTFDHRQLVHHHGGTRLDDDPVEVGQGGTHQCCAVDRPPHQHAGARPRVGEQVVDEHLHPGGTVHGERDEFVGVGVELAPVAVGQELHVAGDHPQRLGQVMRGDVRELREITVRTFQFGQQICHDGRVLARLRQVARRAVQDLSGHVGPYVPRHPAGRAVLAETPEFEGQPRRRIAGTPPSTPLSRRSPG